MDGKALYQLADKRLKDRFGQIEGVAQVTITGGNKRQINVDLNDQAVFQNKISLAQLMQILAAQNMDMPAGSIKSGTQEYSVRFKGQFDSVDKIGDADIPTMTGIKKLRDIATITDGAEDVTSRAIYYNIPAQRLEENIVRISITSASDGNMVDISRQLNEELPEIQKELPEGAKLELVRDDSDFIRATVNDTFSNIWMGIVLTGLVLLLFLHDLRSTLIVALSMPISIVSSFMFMQIAGFSFNMMTLIGISTAVGILVSNSVVVIENIFRHKEMGNSRREASKKGTSEIAIAVLASTLTNIVVFLPLATMRSMVGQFLVEFAVTVTIATLFSLVTSFTITPMLASLIIPQTVKTNKFGLAFDRWFGKFARGYKKFLSFVIGSKRTSRLMIGATVLLLIVSFALVPIIGLELLPVMDMGNITVNVELPQGYNLDQTAKVYEDIHQRIGKHKEIKHIITNLGSSGFIDTGSNIAASDIKLVDAEERKFSSREMADLLTRELADIPNARIKVSASTFMMGGSSPVEFYLQGNDIERLEQLKVEVTERIKDTPGLINLDTSTRSGRSEITVEPRREQMAAIGATVYDLALALRGSVAGMVSTHYQEGGDQYDINISLDDSELSTPDKVGNIRVAVMGQTYLLSQLADISFAPATNRIIHRDRAKSIVFNGDVAEGASLGDVISGINERLEDYKLPDGYKVIWGGEAEVLASTVKDMIRTFALAVLLTYMLLAAILESFVQPLFIMATVPLALIGVIFSLLLAGFSFNIISMLSIIMLVGIVVNNAILLLDYANMKRKQGATPRDALLEAAEMKLKPIVMSTLAVIIGMLPMALGIGASGVEMRQSMGVVSIGGMVVSSFLTMIIIPAFYYLTVRADANKRGSEVIPMEER